MPRSARPDIQEKDLHGFKHFKLLLPVMEKLHLAGCARDRAGNRLLHFDQYAALILLYFFNPIVTSLRAIQQTSQLKKVQRLLGCSRAALVESRVPLAACCQCLRLALVASNQWHPAHVAGKDDRLVKARPLLELEPRWARHLSADTDAETIQQFHRHEATGRPIGSERFQRKLEKTTGRILRPQKPGRKAKAQKQ